MFAAISKKAHSRKDPLSVCAANETTCVIEQTLTLKFKLQNFFSGANTLNAADGKSGPAVRIICTTVCYLNFYFIFRNHGNKAQKRHGKNDGMQFPLR